MKHQIHVSGLNLMSKCGIAFAYRHLQGMKSVRSVSLAVGTAVDRAVRADMQSKISTGILLEKDAVADIARDTAVKEWQKGDVVLSEDEADQGWKGTKEGTIDAAVDLTVCHHEHAGPGINPTHVARSWVLDVPKLDVQVAGEIDIQEADAIRDTKHSAKSPNKEVANQSLQLTMYAFAVRQIDGKMIEKVVLDTLVITPKRRETKLVQIESIRTEQHLPYLMSRIANAVKTIESGNFTPAPTDAWWCSKKFCSYWNICPYSMRPVSVAMKETVNG